MSLFRRQLRYLAAISALFGICAGLFADLIVGRLVDTAFPLVEDLSAPRGLTPLGDGSVLIAEVLGGRILHLTPEGDLSVVREGLPATMGGPGENYPTGVSAVALADKAFYYVVGEFRGSRYSAIYRLSIDAGPELLAGGTGPDGFPATRLTNPYDLVAAPQGGWLVSDAGTNAVLHISSDGAISEYAAFPRRELASPEGTYSFDVVPTGLAIGPDGALYLASLTGFPYPRDAAQVYRLEDRNGDGDAQDPGEVTVFAQGFSVVTDVAFAEDGSLLVTEFSSDMEALIGEFGLAGAARAPGRLLRWRDGAAEIVAEGLVSPTALTTIGERIIVSEEFAGRVSEVRPARLSGGVARTLPIIVGLVAAAMGGAALYQLRIRRP